MEIGRLHLVVLVHVRIVKVQIVKETGAVHRKSLGFGEAPRKFVKSFTELVLYCGLLANVHPIYDVLINIASLQSFVP